MIQFLSKLHHIADDQHDGRLETFRLHAVRYLVHGGKAVALLLGCAALNGCCKCMLG